MKQDRQNENRNTEIKRTDRDVPYVSQKKTVPWPHITYPTSIISNIKCME